jgi:hypothetical protein
MPLVDKQTSNAPGSRVEVFVRTPDSEVHLPVMQLQRNVTYRVSQVPADNAALLSEGIKCVSVISISLVGNGQSANHRDFLYKLSFGPL